MARRGRRSDPEARRRQTTRAARRPRDAGTPEMRARRAALAGAEGAFDPRAGDALGLLNLAGEIGRAQMEAGRFYAVLRWRAFGRPTPFTPVYQAQLEGFAGRLDALAGQYPEAGTRVRDLFARGDNALRNAGRLAWSEARAVSVEHRLPRWYARARAGAMQAEDAVERAALVRGLSALAAAYGFGAAGEDAHPGRARVP